MQTNQPTRVAKFQSMLNFGYYPLYHFFFISLNSKIKMSEKRLLGFEVLDVVCK